LTSGADVPMHKAPPSTSTVTTYAKLEVKSYKDDALAWLYHKECPCQVESNSFTSVAHKKKFNEVTPAVTVLQLHNSL
jgi:hypothetical protein